MPVVRDIDKWFDLNVDIDTRTIYMGSTGYTGDDSETGVDHSMAEYFIKGMHTLESKNNKPILIIMNNPGGDWYHGMAIYDAIKYSSCECTIKVYGHAMSMGSIILQAADHRIMMPNSRFMIHYGYDGKAGHAKIVYKWADEGKRVNWEMENLYLEKMLDYETATGKKLESALDAIVNKANELDFPKKVHIKYKFSTKREERREQLRVVLANLLNYDTILTPAETISLGLADSIFGEE
jgi:ATP-dependent protease ClpP protease subunit